MHHSQLRAATKARTAEPLPSQFDKDERHIKKHSIIQLVSSLLVIETARTSHFHHRFRFLSVFDLSTAGARDLLGVWSFFQTSTPSAMNRLSNSSCEQLASMVITQAPPGRWSFILSLMSSYTSSKVVPSCSK